MSRSFETSNRTEKILEENPFFIISESTVIFKKDKNRIVICLDQISMVRIIKTRDTTPNILLLTITALHFLLSKSTFLELNLIFKFMNVSIIFILLVLFFSLKNYRYKLLINTNKTDFKRISLSKSNVVYAKNFVSKYERTNILKVNQHQANFKCKDLEVLC